MRQLFTIFLLVLVVTGCGLVESSDRDECAPAFKELFGFEPPKSVTEIRHAYTYFRDSDAHWMTFTNDPKVLKILVDHDMELRLAITGSPKHDDIVEFLEEKSQYGPNWFLTPDNTTGTIYYKEDYLDHSFSEFFLWTDKKADKVFLHVYYFL
jgi:hypothetical protein